MEIERDREIERQHKIQQQEADGEEESELINSLTDDGKSQGARWNIEQTRPSNSNK